MIGKIRRIKKQIVLEKNFFLEMLSFWKKIRMYNASSHTDDDMEKMQYTILRENHTIEKGLSMRMPKKGFGQKKVQALILRLKKYADLYANRDPAFLQYPINTIFAYIQYMKKSLVDVAFIEEEFDSLVKKVNYQPVLDCAGVSVVEKTYIQNMAKGDFEKLLNSRHSIRFFCNEVPSKELIIRALELAQKTPSACNRQAWKTHAFWGKQCTELMNWQGGCRGFETEMKCAILVTANLKGFLSFEVHQAYVDGGLYAMNLINALHFVGLGTIPLSTAFEYDKLNKLKRFGIPDNEVPIVIVGVGVLDESFKIAYSTRKEITSTNTFHNI